ncbi:hypothetical protein ACOSP6_11855 [Tenacibaculum sp. MEBiC06402]|uniref:hypothetical protein n=1 Tax=unclassified Tenacibaculum TaxID=2635139 RepID=UPI003B9B80E5
MKRLLEVVLILSVLFAYSQDDKTYPEFLNYSLEKLSIYKNWNVLTKVEGFLNKNEIKDAVLVLESKDNIGEQRAGDKVRKNTARILVVLVDGRVVVQNNTFIARGDERGMMSNLKPEIHFDNYQFTIYYQYTRGNQSYRFEMIENNVCLVGAETNSVHAASGDLEELVYDFKKKKLTIKSGNISEDSKEDKEEVLNIKLNNGLKKLSELTEMYEWEVLKDRYL